MARIREDSTAFKVATSTEGNRPWDVGFNIISVMCGLGGGADGMASLRSWAHELRGAIE